MPKIFLDRVKDAGLQPGFRLITSEVEFLKAATSLEDLHIQGETLCNWAEVFYRGRGIKIQEAKSITRELINAFPEIPENQTPQLVERLGPNGWDLPRPLKADKVLNAIYPSPLWSAQYSPTHLAEWLIWVMENHPDRPIRILMELLISNWESFIDDLIRGIYLGSLDFESAELALENWLGIRDRQEFPLTEEFPIGIPVKLMEKARDKWNFEIIASHGKFFEQVESLAIPFTLLKVCAQETYQYYLQNSTELDSRQLVRLSQYLTRSETSELRKRLPPAPPSEVPFEPVEVRNWYLSEYLPYREWQESFGSEQALDIILNRAREFSVWYLNNYPKGLTGGPLKDWLSFRLASKLGHNSNVVTLIVVLDGLHLADARTLYQQIRSSTSRLTTLTYDVGYAPIPTVTQFAKQALLHGVPPDKSEQTNTIGIVLPENKSPAQRLKTPEKGVIYLWRVLEPDRTYHHNNTSENLLQDVIGRLEAEAKKIKEIVETVPNEVQLQIIITTDHGRLLARSTRKLSVPYEMQSHGRCAWGKSNLSFSESGWIEKENVAYLYGERFGMKFDMAIPLSEESFLGNDGRKGSEAYPHGGLFPEEVIVPWIVFARDVQRPKVEISLIGDGRARGSGTLLIKTVNMSDVDLLLDGVILHYRNGYDKVLPVRTNLAARRESRTNAILEPWPSPAEISGIQGNAKVTQPNGLTFDYSVLIEIKSKDIYDRGENILEDLF